jgi:ElaB/YqjD/DUF883 family membrane-anchored ribosome-binding protein
MTNQDFSGSGSARSTRQTMKEAASETIAKASDMASGMARDTGAKAKQAASDAASTVNEQVREMLDKQISSSWNLAGQMASSFKVAADDLNQTSPFAAGLVRNLAEKVEGYADEFQDQTVEQVVRSASDFTRRQPALVFGLAALAGFLIFRTAKTALPTASPSITPDQDEPADRVHG